MTQAVDKTRGPARIGPVAWTDLPHRLGVSAVVVSEGLLDPSWQFPVIASVCADSGEPVWAWAWREGEVGRTGAASPAPSTPHVAIGQQLQRALSAHGAPGQQVTLRFPPSHLVTLQPALRRHLAEGAIVHISSELLSADRRQPAGHWRLLVWNGVCAPVRCLPDAQLAVNRMRCGMLVRAVIGAKEGDVVQLVDVGSGATLAGRLRDIGGSPNDERTRGLAGAAREVYSLIHRMVRLCDYALELTLRSTLRAPILVVRTTQAPAGDDAASVVRLHPSVFSWLGIKPGMQVIVIWCGVQVVAQALEDYPGYDDEALALMREHQSVGITRAEHPDRLPPHLVGRMSVGVRRQLGVPADTVIEVRRRVFPLVVSHANQLTIPVLGILLAALAVPALHWWEILIGLALVAVLNVVPLRQGRPPTDFWP